MGVTGPGIEKIVEKGRLASDAKHGTTLIISGDAVGEAIRLGGQGFPVTPFVIDEPLMGSAMSIDGGILLDAQGLCHGVGVLLDGKATPLGDSARGSRYNSAVRYVEGRGNAVVLVVSEDGMIDIVPRDQAWNVPAPFPFAVPAIPEADIQVAAYYLSNKRGLAKDHFRDWLAAERGLMFRRRLTQLAGGEL